MNIKLLVPVITIALLAIAAFAIGSEQEYRISSGDRVKVVVYGHNDLSGEFEVDGSGQISLPLIKYLKAADLTKRELEEAITKKLKPDYLLNPKVSLEVLTYRPFYIIGEVRNPGSYPYVTGMTVVNAVALAGGFTYRAKSKAIIVKRFNDFEGKIVTTSMDTKIFPGDVIEVPERMF